jgi:flagellar biosynthesis/type III secretory pathway protein FliH
MKTLRTVSMSHALILSLLPVLAAQAIGCSGEGEDDPLPVADVIVASVAPEADFGDVLIGKSNQMAFTILNEGAADATLSGISTPGLGLSEPFSLTGGTCRDGQVLRAKSGDTCTLAITFAPTSETKSYSDIVVHYTDLSSPETRMVPTPLQIVGNGVVGGYHPAHVTISHPGGPGFGEVAIGNPTSRVFTVLNDGRSDATLMGISTAGLGLSAPFSLTGGSCKDGLVLHGTKGEACTLTIAFDPSAQGPFSATLGVQFTDAATGTVQSNANAWVVSGTGILDCLNHPQPQCPPPAPLLTLSDAEPFGYGTLAIGTSIDHTFTVTNSGNANATLATVTDAALGLAAPYALIGGTCATHQVLAPAAQCTLVVRFAPGAVGVASGALRVEYAGAREGNRVSTRSITGTGSLDCLNHHQPQCPPPAPQIAISGDGALSFGNVAIGSRAERTLTVVNSGNANGTLGTVSAAAIGLSAPYSLIGGTCATGEVLTALGGSCTLIVRLTPTATGAFGATIDIAYSSAPGQQPLHATRAVTGAGVVDCYNYPQPEPVCPAPAPLVSISGASTHDFGSIAIGTYQEHAFTVTNSGNAPANLSGLTSAGLGLLDPYALEGGSCRTGAALAARGGSCTLVVRFTPVAQVASTQTMTLRYSGGATAYTATRGLTGRGVVDCDRYPQPGCPAPAPRLVFSASSVSFGTVPLETVKEVTVTVRNEGAGDATLGTVSTSGLGLSGPFSWAGGSCESNQPIPALDGQCTLRLRFAPVSRSSASGTVSLRYNRRSGGSMSPATLSLAGAGTLDCRAVPALYAAYSDGVGDARAINQAEAARGTADGLDAAYANGYDDGYEDTFEDVYESSYDQAYVTAYAQYYDSAYDRGTNDSGACSEGAGVGRSAGRAAGEEDGTHDGYAAGYDDGLAEGRSDGYDIGYVDGANSCKEEGEGDFIAKLGRASGTKDASSRAPRTATALRAELSKAKLKPKATPRGGSSRVMGLKAARIASLAGTANEEACYEDGYGVTLDPNAYRNAYEAAARSSAAYNEGYDDGEADATADASAEGRSEGGAAGRAAGEADGYSAGQDVAYASCYESAYESSYDSWYDSSYEGSYGEGSDEGYDVGFDLGYAEGYDDGEWEWCSGGLSAPSSARSASAKLGSRRSKTGFGAGKSWAKERGGRRLDLYVAKPIRNGIPVDPRIRRDAARRMNELRRPRLRYQARKAHLGLGSSVRKK